MPAVTAAPDSSHEQAVLALARERPLLRSRDLADAWSQGKLQTDALWRYATVDRVANVMRPSLESLTS